MSTLDVARRYAGALVDLAVESGTLRAVASDLARLADLFDDSKELSLALSNPAFTLAERQGVLRAVLTRLGAHTQTRSFMLLLAERNRLAALPAIRTSFDDLFDARTGRVRAYVTSAAALPKETLDALGAHVKSITGAKEVVVEGTVDPSLIGGVVTRIGDLVLDGSVATQLRLLRERLSSGRAVGDA